MNVQQHPLMTPHGQTLQAATQPPPIIKSRRLAFEANAEAREQEIALAVQAVRRVLFPPH